MSTLAVAALGAVAVLIVVVVVLKARPGRVERHSLPVRRWTHVRAVTADGVTAELGVEYVLRAESGPVDDAVERAVEDAVESVVRRTITASTVGLLPDAGDSPAWLDSVHVPGAVLDHAVVATADVWVTPELRRLVAGQAGAWT